MLMRLGAATESVTRRQETPLQLATKREHLRAYRHHRDASAVDTVRILVQRGENDPMQVDDVGHACVMTAAGDRRNDMLPWLLRQDEYEIDLQYKNPAGHTAAAYISTREDFPELLPPLLQRGIHIKDSCSNSWSHRFGPKISLGGKLSRNLTKLTITKVV